MRYQPVIEPPVVYDRRWSVVYLLIFAWAVVEFPFAAAWFVREKLRSLAADRSKIELDLVLTYQSLAHTAESADARGDREKAKAHLNRLGTIAEQLGLGNDKRTVDELARVQERSPGRAVADGGQEVYDLAETQPDRLWRIQKQAAATNRAASTAVVNAVDLSTSPVLAGSLDDVHGALLDTYENAVDAIDEVEHALDEAESSPGGPTPRQLKREHAERIGERFDGPVRNLGLLLLEHNRRTWLHRRRGTNGAESVARHGLTENQRAWLIQLQEAWGAYDGE